MQSKVTQKRNGNKTTFNTTTTNIFYKYNKIEAISIDDSQR